MLDLSTNINMIRKIRIPSITDNLRLVENMVDEISGQNNFDSEIYGKVLVSTVEAVNNSIIHGNKSNPDKFVDVIFTVDENKLTISIKDEGPGFDYEHVPDPTSPENLEKINGRGVFLMSRLSDEVSFFENGSRVEMVFNIE